VVSLVSSLKAIADEKTLTLFIAVAAKAGNTDSLRKKVAFSRKQYYMRISVLTKAGLIRRNNGIYSLTSLGKVVHSAQSLIGEAVNNYWKLKAIDSIESSDLNNNHNNTFSTEERKKIMDSLIDKESEIKGILLKS
jgi:predicted transcriptional regulator